MKAHIKIKPKPIRRVVEYGKNKFPIPPGQTEIIVDYDGDEAKIGQEKLKITKLGKPATTYKRKTYD